MCKCTAWIWTRMRKTWLLRLMLVNQWNFNMNMYESWHYAKWKKSATNDHMSYYSIYIKYANWANLQEEKVDQFLLRAEEDHCIQGYSSSVMSFLSEVTKCSKTAVMLTLFCHYFRTLDLFNPFKRVDSMVHKFYSQ